ncbi:type II toxin-antitoxin system VapC family toxin [bacterium]|nr:type II toxin-antitoxin system VapC family toxin [bacterium]
MKTFFDSSAFAKRYIEEQGSEIVEDICYHSSSLALSLVCIPEILSALNRRLQEKNLSKNDYLRAKTRLMQEIKDISIINITPGVIQKSIGLLEHHRIRTQDAIHISCALEWQPDLFVSSDKRQIDAAQKSGLKVKFV